MSLAFTSDSSRSNTPFPRRMRFLRSATTAWAALLLGCSATPMRVTQMPVQVAGATIPCQVSDPRLRAQLLQIAQSGVAVLGDPRFQQRVQQALASQGVTHGNGECGILRTLPPADVVPALQRAALQGFSLTQVSFGSTASVAREGSDDAACGRVIALSEHHLRANRPVYLWVGTVVHELSHRVGYLHNSQTRAGNECSVPHVLGDLAEWTASEQAGQQYSLWQITCPVVSAMCRASGGTCVAGNR